MKSLLRINGNSLKIIGPKITGNSNKNDFLKKYLINYNLIFLSQNLILLIIFQNISKGFPTFLTKKILVTRCFIRDFFNFEVQFNFMSITSGISYSDIVK